MHKVTCKQYIQSLNLRPQDWDFLFTCILVHCDHRTLTTDPGLDPLMWKLNHDNSQISMVAVDGLAPSLCQTIHNHHDNVSHFPY